MFNIVKNINIMNIKNVDLIMRFIVMFGVGAVFMVVMQLWWTSAKPSPVNVHSISQVKEPNGNRILEVASRGPPSPDCLRVTQHLIYRLNSKDVVEYVPLGMAMNGINFGSRPEFVVTLEVPEFVPAALWKYVNRSTYFCSVFPGFTKITQVVSAEVPVDLK